jgi:hypothetical protein
VWCGSAWFVVRINIIKRNVQGMLQGSAEKGISEEEGD